MRFILIVLFVLTGLHTYSQNKTINGYVKDGKTGEVLIGANVIISNLNSGSTTNDYGYYSITVPEGTYSIYCMYVGYETANLNINVQDNILHNFWLQPETINLQEISVTAKEINNPLKQNVFNRENLSISDISRTPSLFGEADVLKAIQLKQGIKTIGDGSSAMFIRGGSSDQNLILIDEAPVYNPSHMFGLISVFNADALNNVTLYKSNMPAQYGGRVSGVIDAKLKEGSMYDYNFSAGISLLSATLSANAPIVKGKSSFIIAGRKSLTDFIFKPGGDFFQIVPGFYDINAKVNTKIGERNRVYLSFYNGLDRLTSASGFFNKWGNTTATIRWTSNLTSRLFMNTSFIISNYENYIEYKETNQNYKWTTGVNDFNLKVDLSYYRKPNNIIRFGVGSIYHRFIPGESKDPFESISRLNGFEHALYALHDIKLLDWLGFNYGLRLSLFQNSGKATWYSFNDNHAVISEQINSSGVYNTYFNFEPRMSANFMLNPDYSLKISYARNAQYMQVLTNNSLSYTSLETWFPVTPNVKPIKADVFSIGWFQQLGNNYNFSVEGYYKLIQNQIDFADHALMLNNPYIEGEIREGKARAYGVELAMQAVWDKITANISYTYSRAKRTIHDVNNGKEYSAPYDIPHDFRLTGNYQFSRRWDVGVVFMFMSGRPVTLPVGVYYDNSNHSVSVPIYTERNSGRFPDYHRLDLSLNYTGKKNSQKSYSTFSIGVYNAYNRKNPMGYRFERGADRYSGIRVFQVSLFGVMPNVSYKYHF